MQIRTYNVYKFDELTDEQKQKAIDNLRDINVDYDGCDYVDEDGAITLQQLDTYRGECDIEFTNSAEETARYITANHGEHCDTYKTSKNFLDEYAKIEPLYIKGDESFDDLYSDLCQEYKNELASDYLKILRDDESYRYSDEAIIETIQANDYDFTIDGKID